MNFKNIKITFERDFLFRAIGVIAILLILLIICLLTGKKEVWLTAIIYFSTYSVSVLYITSINSRDIALFRDIANQTLEKSEQIMELSEKTSMMNSKILSFIRSPKHPDVLKEQYLSLHDIYVYYVDERYIGVLYQEITGKKIPQKAVREVMETKNRTGTMGINLKGLTEVSANLGEGEQTSLSLEEMYLEDTITEKILLWQALKLHKDQLGIGYEYTLKQLYDKDILSNSESEKVPQGEELIKEEDEREVSRIIAMNGYVLIYCTFCVVKKPDEIPYIELEYKHPLETKYNSNIKFRVKLQKEAISPQVRINVFQNKTEVTAYLLGYVPPNQITARRSAEVSYIDIVPLAIYSSSKRYSTYEILEEFVNANEEYNEQTQNKINDLQKKI